MQHIIDCWTPTIVTIPEISIEPRIWDLSCGGKKYYSLKTMISHNWNDHHNLWCVIWRKMPTSIENHEKEKRQTRRRAIRRKRRRRTIPTIIITTTAAATTTTTGRPFLFLTHQGFFERASRDSIESLLTVWPGFKELQHWRSWSGLNWWFTRFTRSPITEVDSFLSNVMSMFKGNSSRRDPCSISKIIEEFAA